MQELLRKPETKVLIAGAGPTGLALAIALANTGVKPRIIDRRPAPNPHSRAIVVHGRTLELYASVGLAKTAIGLGQRVDGLCPWTDGTARAAIDLGDFGAGLSPYPFMLSLSQDVHERMLEARLAEFGVTVERGCELEDCADVDDEVIATLRHADGSREVLRASFLCGCDGFHSTTREILGIGFPGGSYQQRFFVADVHASGPLANGRLNVVLARAGFAAVFPLKDDARSRVIGIVPPALQDKDEIGEADLVGVLASIPKLVVGAVDWMSIYHVHHRVAERFRHGRIFLLGDAAHVHSPAGGQGMNTGIGDAFNLGWKLAAVVSGRAPARLLETYEAERRPFAEKLLATTDRAFRYAVAPGAVARTLRLRVLPRVLSIVSPIPFLRRQLFKTVSQIGITYRGSVLSGPGGGSIAPGDRMPWVGPGRGSFRAMDGARWHLVVVGVASAKLAHFAVDAGLALIEIPPARARGTGLRRRAAYLVRPDGHIACIARRQQTALIEAYRRAHGLDWCISATAGKRLPAAAKERPLASVTPAAAALAQPSRP